MSRKILATTLVVIFLVLPGCFVGEGDVSFEGTAISGPVAGDFTLTDQDGDQISGQWTCSNGDCDQYFNIGGTGKYEGLRSHNKFDLVFIDADKENYKNYYEQSLELIGTNGLIIVDNVLWHGEVVNKNNKDKLTSIINEFNKYLNNDKRIENLIMPLGDGLTICRKL